MKNSRLIDQGFRHNRLRYVGQCLFAALCVLAILLVLDTIEHTVTVAALGASAYIAFALPHHRFSQPRLFVGGYLIGTFFGCLCSTASSALSSMGLPVGTNTLQSILAAVAVGLTLFGMVITKSGHPPAAGLALGYVINGWDPRTIMVVLLGISSLAAAKALAKPILIDLV